MAVGGGAIPLTVWTGRTPGYALDLQSNLVFLQRQVSNLELIRIQQHLTELDYMHPLVLPQPYLIHINWR
jgi:hypothetical protein